MFLVSRPCRSPLLVYLAYAWLMLGLCLSYAWLMLAWPVSNNELMVMYIKKHGKSIPNFSISRVRGGASGGRMQPDFYRGGHEASCWLHFNPREYTLCLRFELYSGS